MTNLGEVPHWAKVGVMVSRVWSISRVGKDAEAYYKVPDVGFPFIQSMWVSQKDANVHLEMELFLVVTMTYGRYSHELLTCTDPCFLRVIH